MQAQLAQSYQAQPIPASVQHRIPYDLEIIPLLRAVMRERAMIAVHYGDDRQFLLCSIKSVDASCGRMTIECKSDASQVRMALAAPALTFIVRRGSAKVNFTAANIRVLSTDGDYRIEVDLPEHLLSFDRRRSYRYSVPVGEHVRCSIPLPGAETKKFLHVGVLDISEGGAALLCNADLIDLTPGTVYAECNFEFPGAGGFVASIAVRNSFELAEGGGASVRLGVQFVDISHVERLIVQTYVERLEDQWRDWLPSLDFVE